MRGRLAVMLLAAVLAAPSAAQDLGTPVPDPVPIVTLDQEVLFTGSLYGKATIARFEAEQATLLGENRKIETGLEAEERDLTERRPKLPPEEFRRLAEAFDTKVEAIRAAQDAKSRDLTKGREQEQQKFFQVAAPILADLMREVGAVAIIDKSALVLSFDRIDITSSAIARVDAVLGAGTATPDAAKPAP